MHFTEGNIGGLVFREQNDFVTICDFSGAFDNHPVLGTVVVFLQTRAGTRFDLDTLDLEAPAFVDTVVPPPGAVDLAV